MQRLLIVLSLALASAPAAMACPPVVDDGGTSFGLGGYGASAGFGAGGCGGGFSAGYGAGGCGAPAMAFSAPSYGYGGFAAAPVYSASFAAPVYHSAGYAAGPIRVRNQFRARFAAPVYGYGVAPVRVRSFAAPVYAAPVVAVPVRAVGPIRGAIGGFFGGLRNRINGF